MFILAGEFFYRVLGYRVVTITGVMGSGKSILSVAIAKRLWEAGHVDKVIASVPLAPVPGWMDALTYLVALRAGKIAPPPPIDVVEEQRRRYRALFGGEPPEDAIIRRPPETVSNVADACLIIDEVRQLQQWFGLDVNRLTVYLRKLGLFLLFPSVQPPAGLNVPAVEVRRAFSFAPFGVKLFLYRWEVPVSGIGGYFGLYLPPYFGLLSSSYTPISLDAEAIAAALDPTRTVGDEEEPDGEEETYTPWD